MRLGFTGRSHWISRQLGWRHDVVRSSQYVGLLLSVFYVSCAWLFLLQGASVSRIEIDQMGATRRIANRPKAKRVFPEPLSEREVLILGILSLWRLCPRFFQQGIQTVEDIDNWITVAAKLWEAPADISVKISTASCLRKISEYTFMMPPAAPDYMTMVNIIKLSL